VKGFSLIEVVVVMVLIALTLTLAGPRIGAGFGRLELERARQSIRNLVKVGRVQAERADKEYYVMIDRKQDSLRLLDPDMKVIRQEQLPSSVQIDLDSNADAVGLTISPSGIVRGNPIRLHGRTGELTVELQ
jgi:prepilin-type N-terminal cleavage/methylation domain-containing protein